MENTTKNSDISQGAESSKDKQYSMVPVENGVNELLKSVSAGLASFSKNIVDFFGLNSKGGSGVEIQSIYDQLELLALGAAAYGFYFVAKRY